LTSPPDTLTKSVASGQDYARRRRAAVNEVQDHFSQRDLMAQLSVKGHLWRGVGALAVVAVGGFGAQAAVPISWQAVANCRGALTLQRNAHATATAWLLDHYGLRKPRESDKKLIASCWVYLQRCECNQPGKPILWEIAAGLGKLLTARGCPNTAIKERCRYSHIGDERAGWNEYVAAINDNRPVILT